jgi:hypothetical protein
LSKPEELREAARSAAIIAKALTGKSVKSTILHASQRITVLLAATSTVAPIVPVGAGNGFDALNRELDVVRHLSRRSAPIVPPSRLYPAGPHIQNGFAMTFWPHLEHSEASYDNPEHVAKAARALCEVHHALSDYVGPLPSFRAKINECGMLLRNAAELPALTSSDDELLLQMYNKLIVALDGLSFQSVPIHGDAHLGNVIFSDKGPLWTDFEATSLGPREWDAGFIANCSAFEPIDHALYEVLSLIRSVCVLLGHAERARKTRRGQVSP